MLTKSDRVSAKAAEWWYNFTECFLNIILYRGHKGIEVHKNVRYDEGKRGLLDIIEKLYLYSRRRLCVGRSAQQKVLLLRLGG